MNGTRSEGHSFQHRSKMENGDWGRWWDVAYSYEFAEEARNAAREFERRVLAADPAFPPEDRQYRIKSVVTTTRPFKP